MITITPHNPAWPEQFIHLAQPLRAALAHRALRIDHIGSTAVPNLSAKDLIDIQITAAALTDDLKTILTTLGYEHVPRITHDHLPPGIPDDPSQWTKWFFKQRSQAPHVNLHVRLANHPNQRYALLFRDYLRAHPAAATAYARVKTALARCHPDDLEAYCAIKDPVCDLIIAAAETWAAATHWQPGPADQ